MDIVVKARHTVVAEHFREHAVDKLSKIERLTSAVIRLDVEVSREHNPRQSSSCERVELTCVSRGPIMRAEAAAADAYAALDLAIAKLEARLRRCADRRRVHHGAHTPISVAAATGGLDLPVADHVGPGGTSPNGMAPSARSSPVEQTGIAVLTDGVSAETVEDAPVVVREKVHRAAPMTIDQALLEMELVGHDFYLFVDSASHRPSVVYRRRGYDYGVIRLEH